MTSTYNFFSAQDGPHPDLLTVVARHQHALFQRPIADHQVVAFNRIVEYVNKRNRPLIIDSGCGTGLSSKNLAMAYPDHDVIGIDKSLHRLLRAEKSDTENLLLVRGDLIDLWRLLKSASLPIMRHYLLYPNPWPKISHLKRRFHAHPIFRTMVTLAPYFEMRTNWKIYADEMMMALTSLGEKPEMAMKTDNDAISLFEKKYLEAGCEIFVVRKGSSALTPCHPRA